MRFRLEADFLFEADDLADAQRRLAAHFLRSSMSAEGEISPRGPRGYILIVPAEDPETDFSDA
jgi:hypothetical protein